MKQYDESSISSSESLSDLKRELSRFKDAEFLSTKYIADLEVRLAKSDESVLALREHVERLELECERRRDEARVLQERLEGLKKDGESWRTDLEERERKVRELEAKMEEWKERKKEAGEAWERLGGVASEVQQERKRLEFDLAKATSSGSSSVSGTSTPGEPESGLENQLVVLQQAHTATLADLSSVTAKYRDALSEISDLAAQIQEAKLGNPALTDSPERSVDFGSHRRRMTGGRLKESVETPLNSASRRHFFRQAASTESLHSRRVPFDYITEDVSINYLAGRSPSRFRYRRNYHQRVHAKRPSQAMERVAPHGLRTDPISQFLFLPSVSLLMSGLRRASKRRSCVFRMYSRSVSKRLLTSRSP
jgi:predicted  nucleic acid-binding Zn-ribbon protein